MAPINETSLTCFNPFTKSKAIKVRRGNMTKICKLIFYFLPDI